MVSSWVLDNKALVALDGQKFGRLLDRPLANICPVLFALRVLLLGLGDLPSGFPVVCELLEERSLESKWLVSRLALRVERLSDGAL